MICKLISRILLVLFFWLFLWDEWDRRRWLAWFKHGGF